MERQREVRDIEAGGVALMAALRATVEIGMIQMAEGLGQQIAGRFLPALPLHWPWLAVGTGDQNIHGDVSPNGGRTEYLAGKRMRLLTVGLGHVTREGRIAESSATELVDPRCVEGRWARADLPHRGGGVPGPSRFGCRVAHRLCNLYSRCKCFCAKVHVYGVRS